MSHPDPERGRTDEAFILGSDSWLAKEGPKTNIVASSRVRFARNLADIVFPMRASDGDLARIAKRISEGLENCPEINDFRRLPLKSIDEVGRTFLRENHLISAEFEKGGDYRIVYLNDSLTAGLMINEEDHIRLFCIRPGFCLKAVLREAIQFDESIARELPSAFTEEFGYLTACPTNTGSGMRASVMLHLPGLVLTQRIQEITNYIPDYGLTVRGFYGENSDFMGDYFQISNEQTLGKSEDKILADLIGVVDEIVQKESEAREHLFSVKATSTEDVVWRSYAILTNARVLTSLEASKLLSKIRLGVDLGIFPGLSHADLTRLFVQIQPGHLRYTTDLSEEAESRDMIRAQLLRKRLADIELKN